MLQSLDDGVPEDWSIEDVPTDGHMAIGAHAVCSRACNELPMLKHMRSGNAVSGRW